MISNLSELVFSRERDRETQGPTLVVELSDDMRIACRRILVESVTRFDCLMAYQYTLALDMSEKDTVKQ
jgi:hypothetical protein